MEFYEWWNDKREKYAKDYAMLGAFAIQKVALCAWEAGQDALRATSQPVIEADAEKDALIASNIIGKDFACWKCGARNRTA